MYIHGRWRTRRILSITHISFFFFFYLSRFAVHYPPECVRLSKTTADHDVSTATPSRYKYYGRRRPTVVRPRFRTDERKNINQLSARLIHASQYYYDTRPILLLLKSSECGVCVCGYFYFKYKFILRIITKNIMYSVHTMRLRGVTICGALITGFVRKSRSSRFDVKQLRRVLGNRNDYCYPIKTHILCSYYTYIFRSEAEQSILIIIITKRKKNF